MPRPKAKTTSKPRKSPLYPTTMQILGKTVSIKWSDDIREPGGVQGACNNTDSVIWLSTKLSPAQLQDTALHEVIHLIEMELQLGLDEETVGRLACGLYSAGARIGVVRHLEGAPGC